MTVPAHHLHKNCIQLVDFDETMHGHLVTRQSNDENDAKNRRLQNDTAQIERYAAVPGPTCEETCQHRNLFCEQSDEFLQTVMNRPPVTPQCEEGRYGDVGHTQTSFEYFAQFRGQLVYPSEVNESLVLELPLSGYTTTEERDEQVTDLLQEVDSGHRAAELVPW